MLLNLSCQKPDELNGKHNPNVYITKGIKVAKSNELWVEIMFCGNIILSKSINK